MVGQGVLGECLLDPEVESILSIVRRPSGKVHPKLQELVHSDFFDYSSIAEKFKGYDACFFCLGVSSAGMKEPAYRSVTYDLTMAAAQTLVAQNPEMTFIYVSGASTDSSAVGSVMWARVKGETENALLKLPFKEAYMFRPGYIHPMNGIKSSARLTRVLYAVLRPFYPVMKAVIPKLVTTTTQLGRAMLQIAKQGTSKQVLENRDINKL